MPYGEAVPSEPPAGFHIPFQSEKKPYYEPTPSSGENNSGPGISAIITSGALLLETGFYLLLEDGVSHLLLE